MKLFKRENLPYLLVGLVVLGFVVFRISEHFDSKDSKDSKNHEEHKKHEEHEEHKKPETAAAPAVPVVEHHGLFRDIWEFFFGEPTPKPAAVTPAATASTPAPAESKHGWKHEEHH